jgi:hypothetical protein
MAVSGREIEREPTVNQWQRTEITMAPLISRGVNDGFEGIRMGALFKGNCAVYDIF